MASFANIYTTWEIHSYIDSYLSLQAQVRMGTETLGCRMGKASYIARVGLTSLRLFDRVRLDALKSETEHQYRVDVTISRQMGQEMVYLEFGNRTEAVWTERQWQRLIYPGEDADPPPCWDTITNHDTGFTYYVHRSTGW